MGRRIAEFVCTRSRYPWSDWTDGAAWRIYRQDDYHISTKNMQVSLHGRARLDGLTVKTRSFVEDIKHDHGWVQTREGLDFQYRKDATDE